ncbi:hypothetical protein HDU92_003512 [Lobulomyces angularis]|nr:hypothetical protein HDU92_003512 [Lobulomyces angularis]
MNTKRTSWHQSSQPSSNINNGWNSSLTPPQSPNTNQDWNAFKTELINNNPIIRNYWGSSNLEPASSHLNQTPPRSQQVDQSFNTNSWKQQSSFRGSVTPDRKSMATNSNNSWLNKPTSPNVQLSDLKMYPSEQFQINESWRQMPTCPPPVQCPNESQLSRGRHMNVIPNWTSSSSAVAAEQSNWLKQGEPSSCTSNKWTDKNYCPTETREDSWKKFDGETLNSENSTGWETQCGWTSASPTSTVTESPDWRNNLHKRRSSVDVKCRDRLFSASINAKGTRSEPSSPQQPQTSNGWNNFNLSSEISNSRQGINCELQWKPASNLNSSWNTPPVNNSVGLQSNRKLGQTRHSRSESWHGPNYTNENITNWDNSFTNSNPSWEVSPPTSVYAHNTGLPTAKVAAGWGNPIVHTNLNKRMSLQQLKSNCWNSNSSFSNENPRERVGSTIPELECEEEYDNDNFCVNSSFTRQRQNTLPESNLRRSNSSASFFDSSKKTLASGRRERFPSNQSEEIDLTFGKETSPLFKNRRKSLNYGTIENNSVVSNPRLYIYGLPNWVRVRELTDVFCDFGSVLNVGILSSEVPPFAFVEYEDSNSTLEAVFKLQHRCFFNMNQPLEIHHEQKIVPCVGSSVNGNSNGEAVDANAESTTIHVGNIPQNIQRCEVEKLFSKYGTLKRVQIVNRQKENRAFAFIGYKDHESAERAITALRNSKSLHFNMSEPLKMEYSKIEKRKLSEKSSNSSLKDAAFKEEVKLAQCKKERPFQANINNSVYAKVPKDVEDEKFLEKFKECGSVKYYFFVDRNPSSASPSNLKDLNASRLTSDAKRFAIIIYSKDADALAAVESNRFNCSFLNLKNLRLFNLNIETENMEMETLKIRNMLLENLKNEENFFLKITNLNRDFKSCELEFKSAESCFNILMLILEYPENFDFKVDYGNDIKCSEIQNLSKKGKMNESSNQENDNVDAMENVRTTEVKQKIGQNENGIIAQTINDSKLDLNSSKEGLDIATEKLSLNELNLDNIPSEDLKKGKEFSKDNEYNSSSVELISVS